MSDTINTFKNRLDALLDNLLKTQPKLFPKNLTFLMHIGNIDIFYYFIIVQLTPEPEIRIYV